MKKLKSFFEAKSILAKLNQPKNWKTLPSADRREVRRLHQLRSLTRTQREYIAKVEAKL